MYFLEDFHFIKKFPKSYPLYKKLLCNFFYILAGIVIHSRKNRLTHKDMLHARLKLRKGDIVLVGDERNIFASVLASPITHAAIYVGRHQCINATGKGVTYLSLHKVFTAYDTLTILRTRKKRKDIIKKAVEWARQQKNKPYDFEFKKGADAFFCSELVNEAYLFAGYKTGLRTIKKARNELRKLVDRIWDGTDALHPEEFIRGNFDVVFLSHNLVLKKKKLIYN